MESVLATYYQAQAEEEQQADVDPAEDVAALFDDFVNSKERAESRRKQYMVIKRALLRYEMFKLKTTPGFRRFDVRKTDKRVLDDLTAFLRNEHLYYEQYPEIYEAIPDKKTPPHARGENTMSDLMKKIRAFYNWLELTGHIDRTPFKDYNMPRENYGTPVYLTKDEMQRIYHFDFKNDERAPNIVASLSGHVEGSRAFSRYREIDKEIKTNVVKLLDD